MTETHIISPFPRAELPLMWHWINQFYGQMIDDYSPKSPRALTEKYLCDKIKGAKSYAILNEEEEVIGAVWGELLGDDMYMGHLVFGRYALSPPEKLQATRSALRQFFRDGARKISWQVFPDNRAFLIFLRRLGASTEGRLREATRRNGELVDVILMASFPGDLVKHATA